MLNTTTITRTEYGYEINASTYNVIIPFNDVSLLMNVYMKDSLRESVIYELNNANGDTIDLNLYPYTFDELVDEIYTDLADEIDYGNPPTDETIKDKITEVAEFYEMEI